MIKILSILTKIAIALGVVLVIFLAYYFRSTPDNLFSRSVRHHKQGEICYMQTDFVGAEIHYEKSEELRKRARELE